jgi:hypothetical protein
VRVKGNFASEGAQIVTAFRLVFCGAPHVLGNTGRKTAHLVVEADLTLRASLTMIDRHHDHLARDRGEHAIRLLDELILLDATVIRALIVPAAIALMGRWNWWLPHWPARLLRVQPSLPARTAGREGGG